MKIISDTSNCGVTYDFKLRLELARIVNYDCNSSFIILATVITIVNYDRKNINSAGHWSTWSSTMCWWTRFSTQSIQSWSSHALPAPFPSRSRLPRISEIFSTSVSFRESAPLTLASGRGKNWPSWRRADPDWNLSSDKLLRFCTKNKLGWQTL